MKINGKTILSTLSTSTNYVLKQSSTTGTLINSQIFDDGTNIGIGTTNPEVKVDVYGTGTVQSRVQSSSGGDIRFSVDTVGRFGTYSSSDLLLLTSGTERMRITSGGNVGIGTTSPSAMLTLNGITPYIRIERSGVNTWQIQNNYLSAQNGFSVNNITAGTTPFFIGENGNVGIGTTSPSYQLQLSTDSAAKPTSALWTIASDERIKENINSYTKGLNELLKINPITYDYNGLGGFKKGKGGVGIIAQEIAEILPDSVSSIKGKLNETDEEEIDILNFNGHELTYILINAVKELKAEIEILKNK